MERDVQAADRIRALLAQNREALGEATAESVGHYLDHGEYEMALEGLCIDLLHLPGEPVVDWAECVELGLALGLDKHAAFDAGLWPRLLKVADQ